MLDILWLSPCTFSTLESPRLERAQLLRIIRWYQVPELWGPGFVEILRRRLVVSFLSTSPLFVFSAETESFEPKSKDIHVIVVHVLQSREKRRRRSRPMRRKLSERASAQEHTVGKDRSALAHRHAVTPWGSWDCRLALQIVIDHPLFADYPISVQVW